MNPLLGQASTWTSEITDAAAQIVTDQGVGITAGMTIFVIGAGIMIVKRTFFKAAK